MADISDLIKIVKVGKSWEIHPVRGGYVDFWMDNGKPYKFTKEKAAYASALALSGRLAGQSHQ